MLPVVQEHFQHRWQQGEVMQESCFEQHASHYANSPHFYLIGCSLRCRNLPIIAGSKVKRCGKLVFSNMPVTTPTVHTLQPISLSILQYKCQYKGKLLFVFKFASIIYKIENTNLRSSQTSAYNCLRSILFPLCFFVLFSITYKRHHIVKCWLNSH